jgi:hypothetical protein
MPADTMGIAEAFPVHHVLVFTTDRESPAEVYDIVQLADSRLHLEGASDSAPRSPGDLLVIESATEEGVYRAPMKVVESGPGKQGRSRLVLEPSGEIDLVERRMRTRVLARLEVLVRQDEGEDEPDWIQLVSVDANSEGMRAVSPHHFGPGEELSMQLAVPDGSEPVTCAGRVAWGRTLPDKRHEIGVVFRELADDGRERIIRYLLRRMLNMS